MTGVSSLDNSGRRSTASKECLVKPIILIFSFVFVFFIIFIVLHWWSYCLFLSGCRKFIDCWDIYAFIASARAEWVGWRRLKSCTITSMQPISLTSKLTFCTPISKALRWYYVLVKPPITYSMQAKPSQTFLDFLLLFSSAHQFE